MPVFRKDPCGILTVLLAYSTLIYSAYVVVVWIILRYLNESLWGTCHAIFYSVCVFLCVIVHCRAMLTDPGVIAKPADKDRYSVTSSAQKPSENVLSTETKSLVNNSVSRISPDEERKSYLYDLNGVYLGLYPPKRNDQEESKDWSLCQRCDMMRPPRTHHCRICNGCIIKMDHHCPWVNNCVGAYNQKYFLQFLTWVAITSIYAASLDVYTFFTDCVTCDSSSSDQQQSSLMHRVILGVACGLFGVFVLVMLGDQLSAIFKDETGIESLKRTGPFRQNVSGKVLLREVCGSGSVICWICPWHSLKKPDRYHFNEEEAAALHDHCQV